jgi:hypothetical protein
VTPKAKRTFRHGDRRAVRGAPRALNLRSDAKRGGSISAERPSGPLVRRAAAVVPEERRGQGAVVDSDRSSDAESGLASNAHSLLLC